MTRLSPDALEARAFSTPGSVIEAHPTRDVLVVNGRRVAYAERVVTR